MIDTPLTPEDIGRLKKFMENLKATQGPWQVSGVRGKIISGKRVYNYHGIGPDGLECAAVWYDEKTGSGFHDAHVLCAAINALPSLIAVIEQLMQERDTP